jgi:hypothetical protein
MLLSSFVDEPGSSLRQALVIRDDDSLRVFSQQYVETSPDSFLSNPFLFSVYDFFLMYVNTKQPSDLVDTASLTNPQTIHRHSRTLSGRN